MSYDPYWNNVVLAMHMDDAGLTDVKGHAVTLNGNASRSAAQSKFGGYSAYFDGSGDYLTTPYVAAEFDWWTQDFTIEMWVYYQTLTGASYFDGSNNVNPVLIGCMNQGSGTNAWSFGALSDGKLKFYYYNGAPQSVVTSSSVVSSGVWTHLAMTKSSAGVTLWANGVVVKSAMAIVGTPTNYSLSELTIGRCNSVSVTGYIDDLRITNGVARYTANFTPPTEAFPDRGAMLAGTVKDSSGNFAARLVRAYRRSDGAFAGQTVSNATTGAYSITTLDDTSHFAVVHDGAIGDYDPYWNNVVLAMHMDDAGLTDVKGHAITLSGNAARSAVQSKFGGYSAYFDGAGDYLYPVTNGTDFAFGTGDFTVEMWVYLPSLGAVRFLYDGRPASTNGEYVSMHVSATNTLVLMVSATSKVTGTTALTASTWYHVALCRSGTSTKLFLNGVQEGATYSDSNAYLGSANRPLIGIDSYNSASYPMLGYIDDLRVTKGVARYTANFTPPTSAFLHGPPLGSPTENALILDNITPL